MLVNEHLKAAGELLEGHLQESGLGEVSLELYVGYRRVREPREVVDEEREAAVRPGPNGGAQGRALDHQAHVSKVTSADHSLCVQTYHPLPPSRVIVGRVRAQNWRPIMGTRL